MSIAVYSVFSCLSAAAPGDGWLLLARFITGLGLGGCVPVAYAVVAEFMPRNRRGMFLTAVNLFWLIGATLLGLVAIILIPYESWRLLLLCMGIPSFAVLLAVALVVPESPLFLAQSGRPEDAQAIYHRLAQLTGALALDFQYVSVPARTHRAHELSLLASRTSFCACGRGTGSGTRPSGLS
jgi:MFS transporter, putative metabolite:H+ symporter